jgi:hypothetical protein
VAAPSKEEIHEYLIELRDSGATNMWGAAPFLQARFGMNSKEAREALVDWIKSFSE